MTEATWSRREVLRTALAACGALLAPRPLFAGGGKVVLRLGLVLPPAAARTARTESAALGVTLGVEEAGRTAALLGRAVELHTVEAGAVEGLVAEQGVTALVGGFDEPSVRTLGAAAEAAQIPLLNIGCSSDTLRRACGGTTFHVEASAAMYADARRSHQGREPVGQTRAVLWHPALERFGAAQLNDRFRARFARGMDGPAWAGWMAAKLLWEASLRAPAGGSAPLVRHLDTPSTQFDGHKGWPLSFRAGDRQLRQPLYLVAGPDGGDRLVGEVPVRPAEGAASSRELLDRLGGGASASTCRSSGEGRP